VLDAADDALVSTNPSAKRARLEEEEEEEEEKSTPAAGVAAGASAVKQQQLSNQLTKAEAAAREAALKRLQQSWTWM
jgi:hypothetical protein